MSQHSESTKRKGTVSVQSLLLLSRVTKMDKFPNDPLEIVVLGVCLTVVVMSGFFLYYLGSQV